MPTVRPALRVGALLAAGQHSGLLHCRKGRPFDQESGMGGAQLSDAALNRAVFASIILGIGFAADGADAL